MVPERTTRAEGSPALGLPPGGSHDTWVFDVDGCLIDSLTGTSLRPGALELLRHLYEIGARILAWSAGGAEYAQRRLRAHGVDHLVASFHDKALRDGDGRYVPPSMIDQGRCTFVDDRPEDVPVGVATIVVRPYLAENPHDQGLQPVSVRAGVID